MTDRTCSLEGCDKKHVARGYCHYHHFILCQYGPDGLAAMGSPCSVDGCDKPIRSIRSMMCRGHAQMLAKHGTVDPVVTAKRRFESKYEIRPDGCWQWTGAKNYKTGYGNFYYPLVRRSLQAHRVSWLLHCGPIPDDLTIDHLCRNTSCVNPDHLEPVSFEENQKRRAAAVTHCPRGHEYTPENTIRSDGMRSCRTCVNDRNRDRYWNRGGREAQQAARARMC